MKTESFLKTNYQLLDNGYSLVEATIISYLKSFQEQNKYCYQSKSEIAKLFKVSHSTINRSLQKLIKKGIVFTSQDKKYLKAKFNNRKAIILVDDKNPLPIVEAVAGQTKTTKEVPTVEITKESLPQAKEIIISQLEKKISLPENMQHLKSYYWQEDDNVEWLLKYVADGYKIEDVTEAKLKIRLENYKERNLITNN
jgi:transposase